MPPPNKPHLDVEEDVLRTQSPLHHEIKLEPPGVIPASTSPTDVSSVAHLADARVASRACWERELFQDGEPVVQLV
jgi:hypothetical protein